MSFSERVESVAGPVVAVVVVGMFGAVLVGALFLAGTGPFVIAQSMMQAMLN